VALPEITMGYTECHVVGRETYHPGLFKLTLDRLPIEGEKGELAGRYFFLLVPGVGEKPFAIYSAEEKSIIVRIAGRFTQHLAGLSAGDKLYLRGPYGKKFPRMSRETVVLIGGGTGIASLLEVANLLSPDNELHFLLGGRSKEDLVYVSNFSTLGRVKLASNDGSAGHKGFVSDLLVQWFAEAKSSSRPPKFIICGPDPMVEACFKLLKSKAGPTDVWGAIEYMTSCGVGICGKCASPSGLLTCIDGPFMQQPCFDKNYARVIPESASLATCR
jgi:NAD(P)H-flavin reductase